MSGQSWHEITVSRESRHPTTAFHPRADGFDEAADGRLMTRCGHTDLASDRIKSAHMKDAHQQSGATIAGEPFERRSKI
jgi:hypothetical protein